MAVWDAPYISIHTSMTRYLVLYLCASSSVFLWHLFLGAVCVRGDFVKKPAHMCRYLLVLLDAYLLSMKMCCACTWSQCLSSVPFPVSTWHIPPVCGEHPWMSVCLQLLKELCVQVTKLQWVCAYQQIFDPPLGCMRFGITGKDWETSTWSRYAPKLCCAAMQQTSKEAWATVQDLAATQHYLNVFKNHIWQWIPISW